MEMRAAIIPAVVGFVIGAVAATAIGFSAMGWKTSSTAEQMATARAEAAVVDLLTPVCVARFQEQDDYSTQLAKVKDAPAWTRYQIIEKAGWATVPGTDETHAAVARACAEKIGELS